MFWSRAPCDHYDPLRRPYFGDLHVHGTDGVDFYTRYLVVDDNTQNAGSVESGYPYPPSAGSDPHWVVHPTTYPTPHDISGVSPYADPYPGAPTFYKEGLGVTSSDGTTVKPLLADLQALVAGTL